MMPYLPAFTKKYIITGYLLTLFVQREHKVFEVRNYYANKTARSFKYVLQNIHARSVQVRDATLLPCIHTFPLAKDNLDIEFWQHTKK